ncbi:MAG: sulfatase-like hydrolase/transferase, partial [Spirochaetia bacterium]|nr:sulfatase-like hydrolase/transferase [Spirochaetia bacterium]
MNPANNLIGRRAFLKSAALLGLGATLKGQVPTASTGKKPNVLVIMTDQQRFDALGAFGNPVIRTPNLDRLTDAGVHFTQAVTPCAVCGPARSAILTGRTIQRTGIRSNKDDGVENGRMPGLKTYDELLVEAGYVSEYFGKWHSPLGHGLCYNNTITPVKKWDKGPGLAQEWREFLNLRFPVRAPQAGEQIDLFSQRPYRTVPVDARHGLEPGTEQKVSEPDVIGITSIPKELTFSAFTA